MTTTPDTPIDSEQLADEAAPLDALLVDAALGPLVRFAPNLSTAKFAFGLARRPLTTGRRPRRRVAVRVDRQTRDRSQAAGACDKAEMNGLSLIGDNT